MPGSGGALPPADEIRKLAEQIVGGHRPLETGAAEPEGDVGEPAPSSISRPDAEAQGSSPSPPDGSFPDQPGPPETLPPPPSAVMAEAPQPVAVRRGRDERGGGVAAPQARRRKALLKKAKPLVPGGIGFYYDYSNSEQGERAD